uniref:cGMP-dependent protein kinase n=1 Tax=Cryptomonas curvata TaxID=233186 RepID=A0A7S0QLN4_9CRYP|mmetsp:Transcript_3976/g.8772  ORF Transcript_3976/g.8772 Transcript_3976/m.8772 type:complete len:545 (+) Transcript_3976:190-1824(+)
MGILSKGITKYYEIGKTIGKGSFATVKEGVRKDTGQKVAIKVIDKKDAVFDAESLEQEIATMKKVNHPNCVALHGVFDESSKTYLVLDLITGGTVMDRIIANDHFSEKDAASVTADVLNAIHYLHSIGITHRDLKPENLLYASNDPDSPDYNTIKVADFGLAKFVTENSMMKTTCGTPGYVAPEVLDPYLPFTNGYGPEVDLWSMGVVLYIMLCGFPPFYDDSTAVLFKQIRKGEYTFPSPYWDEVSQGAKDIVSKMLVVDPTKRYTARQCLDHPWIRNAGEASAKKMHSSHRAFLLIRKLPIFDNIDPTCLQEVTVRLKVVRVEQGKFICRAGEPGDCMFFINSGTVQILVNGNEVDRLTTGDFFGEISLTVSSQRTADVKSLGATGCHGPRGNRPAEAVELFQLDRRDFDAVQDKYPVLKSRLAQIGESRVKRASAPVSQEAGAARSESPPRPSSAAKENGRDSQEARVASPAAAAAPAPKSSGGGAGTGTGGGGGGASAAAASSAPRGGGNSTPASPASPTPARKPEVASKESSGCQCVCS